jgi:hypothetical protein
MVPSSFARSLAVYGSGAQKPQHNWRVIGGSNAYLALRQQPRDKAELYSRVSLDLEHESVQIDKTSWWAAVSAKRRRSTQWKPLIASAASDEAAGASDGGGGWAREAASWKFYRSPLTIFFTKPL